MAARPNAIMTPPIPVGMTSSDLMATDGAWFELHNFVRTEEGGLVSISGPMPYLTRRSTGGAPTNGSPNPGISPDDAVYGTVYGVFHARLKGGERDVMLAIVDDQLWEFRGWRGAWYCLAGPASAAPDYPSTWEIPTTSDFPPQFAATSTGIVIVPSNGRALFYDGEAIGPLGYDKAPSSPIGLGPESSGPSWFPNDTMRVCGINDGGYSMDGLVQDITGLGQHDPSYMHPIFRHGRVGTVDTPGNVTALSESGSEFLKSQVMGYLKPGCWRAAVQYLDRWGNLSPLSPESNEVRFARQPAMVPFGPEGVTVGLSWVNVEQVRKQVAWTGLSAGPDGTVGRILYRTKDLENSGDPRLYEVPRDALVTPGAFATLPDNVSSTYCDNIPDAWLSNLPVEVQAVPQFRLCTVAFGRLWMANAPGQEGALWWSLVGKWGTIGKQNLMFPDSSAAEITGLHRVNGGLLAFTQSSTFLITPNDAGDGYRSVGLSSTVGCVAPSSIVTTRDGLTIWLGRDGFYMYDGTKPQFMWEDHRDWAKRFNRARLHRAVAAFDHRSGEYRCWASYDGEAGNGRCFTYDASGWRTRDDVKANGTCVTDDHRRYQIVAGEYNSLQGVWALDRAGQQVDASAKTAWIGAQRGMVKHATRRVAVLLRETRRSATDANKITVQARINWRSEVVSTGYANTFKEQTPKFEHNQNPGFWDRSLVGDDDAVWRRRRPFWAIVDLDIGACDSFQLEFTCPRRYELLGYAYQTEPKSDGGTRQT